MQHQSLICPLCQEPIRKEDRFCYHCGSLLPTDQESMWPTISSSPQSDFGRENGAPPSSSRKMHFRSSSAILSRRALIATGIAGSLAVGSVLGGIVGYRIASQVPPGKGQARFAILECLGDTEGHRYLDGHTAEGIVSLAPSTISGFTGTYWELNQMSSEVYTLRCQGVPVEGNVKTSRYLEGRIAEGKVGLASDIHPGTYWELKPLSDRTFTLKCQSDLEGNSYLDGNTAEGTVGLAPAPGGNFTGAIWGIYTPIT